MSDETKPTPDQMKAAWDAVQSAVRQFNAGEEITARCPFCENALVVEGIPRDTPSQWFVRCPCGKCSTTIKGL